MANETTTKGQGPQLSLPIEVGPKGKRTITIDMDEFEMDETGTKTKSGIPTAYFKFKLLKQ